MEAHGSIRYDSPLRITVLSIWDKYSPDGSVQQQHGRSIQWPSPSSKRDHISELNGESRDPQGGGKVCIWTSTDFSTPSCMYNGSLCLCSHSWTRPWLWACSDAHGPELGNPLPPFHPAPYGGPPARHQDPGLQGPEPENPRTNGLSEQWTASLVLATSNTYSGTYASQATSHSMFSSYSGHYATGSGTTEGSLGTVTSTYLGTHANQVISDSAMSYGYSAHVDGSSGSATIGTYQGHPTQAISDSAFSHSYADQTNVGEFSVQAERPTRQHAFQSLPQLVPPTISSSMSKGCIMQ